MILRLAFNSVIELLIIYLSSKIVKYHTFTEQTKANRNCILTLYFLNTVIALLLVGANLPFSNIPYLEQIPDGEHSDFTHSWYTVFGIQVVLYGMADFIGPLISYPLFVWLPFIFVKRCLD